MAETSAERMARQSDDAFEAKHGFGKRPNGTQRLPTRLPTGALSGRDLNDARVTFTELGLKYGLGIEQVKAMWRAVTPPYPKEPENG